MRKKPNFYRRQWRMKLRLKRKSERKWVRPRGRDNKVRLNFRGVSRKVKIGWGNDKKDFKKINGSLPVYISDIKQMANLSNRQSIILAKVGKKKRTEMIKQANSRGLKIINKYKRTQKDSSEGKDAIS